MNPQQLIHRLVEEQELVVPTLFKPVQFRILHKLEQGQPLTDNEQRYRRGNLQQKLKVLQQLLISGPPEQELPLLLNFCGPYYITGLEALRHHGYGWFYETKVIEVINTKIAGKVTLLSKTIKFIRIKSLSKSKIIVDRETGLRYASSNQIFKDVAFTKNEYSKSVWMQMYRRYGVVFVKKKYPFPAEDIDFTRYGV